MVLVHMFLCNVIDTRALIGHCSFVTSPWYHIRKPYQVKPFTIAHIVISLSLHIHSFLHSTDSTEVKLVQLELWLYKLKMHVVQPETQFSEKEITPYRELKNIAICYDLILFIYTIVPLVEGFRTMSL